MTEKYSISVIRSRLRPSSVTGHGQHIFSRAVINYSMISIEAMAFFHPKLDLPLGSLSIGAGLGRYEPSIKGGFRSFSSTKFGPVFGAVLRPLENRISLDLAVMYRIIPKQNFDSIEIVFQDELLNTLQSGHADFSGFVISVGLSFRLGGKPRFERISDLR